MKKIVSLLLILVMAASLSACALPGTVTAARPGVAALGAKALLSGHTLHTGDDPEPTAEPSAEPAAEPSYEAGDRVYYGWSMESDGMEIVMSDYPSLFDPKDYCLILRADGTAILYLPDEEPIELTWTDTELGSEGESIPYLLEEDRLSLLLGEGESLTFLSAEAMEASPVSQDADPMADVRSFWEGDWYGFWVMEKSTRTGDYANWSENWWDACVRITVNEDGTGHLVVFDEDAGEFSFLAECDVAFAEGASWMGKMASTAGTFWGQDLSNGAWAVDPALTDVAEYDGMITFESEFADEDGTFRYYYILRRWGTDWADVAEEGYPGRPFYYETWYLPLVEAGEECPFDFTNDSPAEG